MKTLTLNVIRPRKCKKRLTVNVKTNIPSQVEEIFIFIDVL